MTEADENRLAADAHKARVQKALNDAVTKMVAESGDYWCAHARRIFERDRSISVGGGFYLSRFNGNYDNRLRCDELL